MWLYNGEETLQLPETTVGFVYIITNNLTDRKYIGKKLSKFSKTKYKVITQKNGIKKKKKIKSQIDSDWLDYYGSSDELTADVVKLGKENFTREIIRLCFSKTELSYYEAKMQFDHDVLLSDKWYNSWIMVRVRKTKTLTL
jgi:hypothetical protein